MTDQQITTKRAANLILLSVCIGQALVGLDQRAITVALPTLAKNFDTPFTTIQWTILVYDLVLIGLIITMGRLGDLFGRRRFYALGFLIFVSASAICGLTQTTGQLIFFRAVQALGGSMIAANGRAIVSVNLPPEERGRALGLTSTAFHIGFLTGPSLGGFLIDSIGWRWIFYINLPFSLAGAYLAWKIVPETRMQGKTSVDISGALLLLLANGLFIYAIDQLPLVVWGIGWALFNAPNQSAILGAVSSEKIGTAAGMISTTARTGGAMGVALSATLFGYLLTAAGLGSHQVNSPESWRATPEIFMSSFSSTIYALSCFTLLAAFSSAVRGKRRED